MKKLILIILIILVSFSSLIYAEEENGETVSFKAIVPSDYGVSFPEDAVRLDRLFFQLPNGDLVGESNIDEFVIEVGESSLPLDIVYYGNLENDYRVIIDGSSEGWFVGDNGDIVVPVSIEFEDYLGDKGISAVKNEDGSILLNIPASGARLAEKAGSLILTWEYPLELIPGGYTMELNLHLRSAA